MYRHAALLLIPGFLPCLSQAQENPATQLDLPQVVVVGTTPLPALGLPPEQIPANVQTLSADDLRATHAVDVASGLNRSLAGININDTQGNPFETDLNFRGFTASPVLGTPQGLSVFVDGVRANEALGDTINWDLIPNNAIARITVMPGSDPVFGLNTLGGAVSVATKSGFEFPGTRLDLSGGSFGRGQVALETGGHGESLDYFLAGNVFRQSGWAQHSPSNVRQAFGKTGYQNDTTDVDLSLSYADNRLEGSQTLPRSWLDTPKQPYSWPDIQTNRLWAVNLKASHYLAKDLLLSGELYFRHVTTQVFNSNVSDNFDPMLPVDADNSPASNALNTIDEQRPGGSLQLTWQPQIAGHKNTLVVGASLDRGRVGFTQSSQSAPLSSDRGTLSNDPIDLTTSLRSTNTYKGLYAMDTVGLGSRFYWTVSARYNDAALDLDDQLGTALNGHHRYTRLNPATGLTFNPSPKLTAYAAYNEGMRVPTAVELTCADPNAPCSLPNAFSSDPDLKPVLSRSWEIGARGHSGSLAWRVAGFDTELRDDIQFISSGGGAISAGYFQNVGRTRRLGVEAGLDASFGALTARAQLSHIEATYRSSLVLNSPSNSGAQPLSCPTCTDILVVSGDRIPGIPENLVKLSLEYAFSAQWSASASFTAQSGLYARGDENNSDVNGRVPGFGIIDLQGRYEPSPHWEMSLRIENLLDREYSTFAQLGRNLFTGPDRTFDYTGQTWRSEQFRSVGAPRGIWFLTSYRVR